MIVINGFSAAATICADILEFCVSESHAYCVCLVVFAMHELSIVMIIYCFEERGFVWRESSQIVSFSKSLEH